MVPTPRCDRPQLRQGFSLVELSVVVAIMSVVATFGLEAASNFVNRSATSVSRERLAVVDEAVAQFFRVYGRLPCPASSWLDPTNTSYGLENCTSSAYLYYTNDGTHPGNGLYAGAVPFRTLNLPMLYALDGFTSKLNYIVTANLTVAGGGSGVYNRFNSSGGTIVQNGIAGIEVRTGVLEQPCNTAKCQVIANPAATPPSGAAYFIFSNGPDQRGAYSVNGTLLNPCSAAAYFASEKRPDTENCQMSIAHGPPFSTTHTIGAVSNIPDQVFYDNRYNAGLNLVSYFDDVVIWRTKGQL